MAHGDPLPTRDAPPSGGMDTEWLMKRHARRHSLQREQDSADQGLLIGAPGSTSGADAAPSEPVSHARRRLLAKENVVADVVVQRHGTDGAQTFGRVMGREGSAPPALLSSQAELEKLSEEVGQHARKSMLLRERNGTLMGAGANEGQTFSRILGR